MFAWTMFIWNQKIPKVANWNNCVFPNLRLIGIIAGFNNLTYSLSPLYYSPEPSSAHDFDRLYLGLDNGTIAEISHHPSAFIKNCTVGGIITSQCRALMSKGGHRRFLGSTFGFCYTYNLDAIAADMKSDYVRRSGEHAGLELLLDTEGKYLQ